MNKREILNQFLNGEITRAEVRELLKTERPIVCFDGVIPPNPDNRPIIRFTDNSIRDEK